ncbi:MAG: alpha/beta fold hydrolase [Rhabdochlamydiaceae bacterium]|nr:alpha/beta fold hydrolase [Candidatus Amphrikana amoebophyrae]
MLKKIAIALSLFVPAVCAAEQVVCIHGFMGWRSKMLPIAKHLRDDGHYVRIWGYDSRAKKTACHSDDLVRYLNYLAKQKPGVKISFVTHSFGALLVRSATNHPDCPKEAKRGRAVLIAPPNKGCKFGRIAGKWQLVQATMGDYSGKELIESSAEDIEKLGAFPRKMSLLVIAGRSWINPILREPNDGLLKIKETRLDQPHKHVIIDSNHDSLLSTRDTLDVTREFFITN